MGFSETRQPIQLGCHNSRSNSSVIEMSFLQLFEEKFRELNFMPDMFSCLINKEKMSCINHHIEIPHFFPNNTSLTLIITDGMITNVVVIMGHNEQIVWQRN